MKGRLVLTPLVVMAMALVASPALAAIESFDATSLESSFGSLTEIDFENLHLGCDDIGLPCTEPPVTSIRIGSVTFSDLYKLSTGFCSSPTCSPDPDNPYGPGVGNNVLVLNEGGSLSFTPPSRLIVLDVQGIGDNPFELLVTGTAGETLVANGQGVLFGRTLLGLRSRSGIKRIELTHVGGTRGPIVLARVLYQGGR